MAPGADRLGLESDLDLIGNYSGRQLKLMEVCGTHTAAIFRSGVRDMLSSHIELISGPGCPVCVTPPAYIDKCIELSLCPNTAIVSFGDMLKVPGADLGDSLSSVKSRGGRVEMVYSPFDVLNMAEADKRTEFIVAAVGFETTAPVYCLLIEELTKRNITNVKLLTALKSAIAAIEWILINEPSIDGFLCPGHVSVITGSGVYEPLAREYNRPFVVAGFEPLHVGAAIGELVRMISSGNSVSEVRNLYPEVVTHDGNLKAMELMARYYNRSDVTWRGLGRLPGSGYTLREAYCACDVGSAELEASSSYSDDNIPAGCRCADVITGRITPPECPMFARTCNPLNPLGPCMVSAEGACGIWHQFQPTR